MSLSTQLEQQGIILHGTPTQMRTLSAQGNLVKPSPITGFWKNCPALYYADPTIAYAFFEDFHAIAVDDTTGLPTAYKTQVDTTGTFALGAVAGGTGILTTHTDANDAACMQFGAGRFAISKDSGKKLWAEFRLKIGAHANIVGAFVGLATAGYDYDILTDTTGVLAASKNLVGFRIIAATPAAWQACWKTGSATIGTVAAVANADDFHTFGIYFDGISTVQFYVDRVALGTTVEVDATAFPSDIVGTPFVAVKTATGAQALTIDWIKAVQLR